MASDQNALYIVLDEMTKNESILQSLSLCCAVDSRACMLRVRCLGPAGRSVVRLLFEPGNGEFIWTGLKSRPS